MFTWAATLFLSFLLINFSSIVMWSRLARFRIFAPASSKVSDLLSSSEPEQEGDGCG